MQGLKKGAKPLSQIKNIHTEHVAKLQGKNQLETELLDDVRNFCKARALIDKEYGVALQKLANAYITKRELLTLSGSDDESRNIWYVWRCLLEHTQSVAGARLKAGDTLFKLSEQLKPLRTARAAANKRIIDQLKSLQFELTECLQEMVKANKIYAEEEKQAHDARTKARDADDKVRRRSTSIFNSMAQLHRNSAKMSGRRDLCVNRSTAARNEYLFQLSAINAHLEHYSKLDVPELAKILDGDIYEHLNEVFACLGRHELDFSSNVENERLAQVLEDATSINRECTWDQFISDNPAFAETVQYQFEPTEGDPVSLLKPPSEKPDTLVNVTRKLVRRLVLREKKITDYQAELRAIQAGRFMPQFPQLRPDYNNHGSPVSSEDQLAYSQEYLEHKMEDLQFTIRRGEIELVKIRACLELLKDSGVDVNSMLQEAYEAAAASAAAKQDAETDAGSSYAHSQGSGTDFEAEWAGVRRSSLTRNGSSPSVSPHSSRLGGRRASSGQDRGYGGEASGFSHGSMAGSQTSVSVGVQSDDLTDDTGLLRGVVCYEYRAVRPDELDLVVDETVLILGSGDSEGWLRARSLIDGREGFIPAAFIEMSKPVPPEKPSQKRSVGSHSSKRGASGGGEPSTSQRLRVKSSRRRVEEEEEEEEGDVCHTYVNWRKLAGEERGEEEAVGGSVDRERIDEEEEETGHAYVNWGPGEARRKARMKTPPESPTDGEMVRAVVDFAGKSGDELNFSTGQILRVISRQTAEGVDDGWWEGQLMPEKMPLQGEQMPPLKRGFFPSMVVEPLKKTAEVAIAQPSVDLMAFSPPNRPAAPDFTPPPLVVSNNSGLAGSNAPLSIPEEEEVETESSASGSDHPMTLMVRTTASESPSSAAVTPSSDQNTLKKEVVVRELESRTTPERSSALDGGDALVKLKDREKVREVTPPQSAFTTRMTTDSPGSSGKASCTSDGVVGNSNTGASAGPCVDRKGSTSSGPCDQRKRSTSSGPCDQRKRSTSSGPCAVPMATEDFDDEDEAGEYVQLAQGGPWLKPSARVAAAAAVLANERVEESDSEPDEYEVVEV